MMPTKSVTKVPRSRSQQRLHWVVVALVAFALVIVFMALAQSPAQDYAFSTTTTKGEPVSLVDYKGHVVMLNFWATWCPPCRAEMPMIETAYKHYKDQGFVVLAVNNAERSDQVSSFADQYKLTFPILLDYSADIQQQFAIKGYPTSLFLDAKGKVYATHQGGVTADQLANYIETGLQRPA